MSSQPVLHTSEKDLALLTGGLLPLVPRSDWYQFKELRVTGWSQESCLTSGRDDQLRLSRWVKRDSLDQATSFECFKRSIDIPRYTDEEYASFLTDESWTREETDTLFNLCQEYDLRFFIVHDRYPSEYNRSVEDLKDRFYTVMNRLAQNRSIDTDDGGNHQQLKKYSTFVYKRELADKRKAYLEDSFKKSFEQVMESDVLILEIEKMKQRWPRYTQERANLLRVLGPAELVLSNALLSRNLQSTIDPLSRSASGMIGRPPMHPGVSSAKLVDKSKKRRRSQLEEKAAAAVPIDVIPGALPIATPPRAPLLNPHAPGALIPPLKPEKLTQGVHLRSTRVSSLKTAYAKKVEQMIQDLGAPLRPITPTAAVIQAHDDLRAAVQYFFELKRLVEQAEIEVNTLKGGGPLPATSTMGETSTAGTPNPSSTGATPATFDRKRAGLSPVPAPPPKKIKKV